MNGRIVIRPEHRQYGGKGIVVKDQAQPTLEDNVCENNERSGIAYFDRAGGVARNNECSGNRWGIYVEETADPKLEGNKLHDNLGANLDDERP